MIILVNINGVSFMTKTSEKKQLAILKFIYERVTDQGYPPTVREICEAVNLSSTSTVHGHLTRLEKKGYLEKDATKPRAIELTAAGLSLLGIKNHQREIPMVGTVTAGSPILAVEETSDFFPLPPEFDSADNLFMLTIRGESMINAGILNGDQVIVRKQRFADNGDIVIALTEESEATCKRFFKENGHFRLQPENDSLNPIILQEVLILGKVIGLYRNFL
jgi:repressor LexA